MPGVGERNTGFVVLFDDFGYSFEVQLGVSVTSVSDMH
jgi:hypothetical protein